ncbi:cysteine hydrolase [Roseiarcaceae bacterium H3SJ34-1]|uniref:cysteine hydrolase family protein n=1 Tax=Terripilifer ovatus TaxID=3032367 RepID=UPI003AB94E6B|nr:cysteine hydrolase [Roseiarcaceae bacterium H3SJ34-1]
MKEKADVLRFGELTAACAHLCIDMQRMFAEETEWRTPWMNAILPNVLTLVSAHPDRTIFTRFIPPKRVQDAAGAWKRYYERWPSMTLEHLHPDMVRLVPELARFTPPAEVLDKHVYSPWYGSGLHLALTRRGVDTLILSGAETDVCVLAAVLGAVDRGYRVILATDALCSSTDETHDALLTLYRNRYGQQIETVSTATIAANWG